MAEALQRAELLRPEASGLSRGCKHCARQADVCAVLNKAILSDACLTACQMPHMSTLWQETARHSTSALRMHVAHTQHRTT